MEKTLKAITGALLLSTLAACGGGGSDDKTETTTPPVTTTPEPTLIMPSGVWSGTITMADGIEQFGVVGLISSTGEFRFITEYEEQNTGTLSLSDKTNYTANVDSFIDNAKAGAGTLTGTYNPTAITGETSFDGAKLSSFSIEQLAMTNDAAGLDVIAGNYVDADLTTSIMLDDSGDLSGSDTFGCQYTGTVEHKDADINLYSLKLTVSSCADLDGEYSGLATYGKVYDDVPAGLIFQGSNAAYSLTNILFKG
ncbi:hypothetical protein [Pseudoalteromonas sp. JB197]|uniref:hypothetical protein n=1 Tax=Pseudoalteromonas sp. JB197 TaxID=1434839 RepID=UPI00097F4072|nr:hypothetical protein [Pseudoalteromonas sp. JB197]PCC12894.1 hypothetical protein CIK86_06160 [Pseudoalteromonas sp. JB197]SJN25627.1 hypothetical protein CZ797_04330 [Pseudoalteromonas sp. JB197]